MEPAQSGVAEADEAGRDLEGAHDEPDGAAETPSVPEGYLDGWVRARIAQGALAVDAVLYVAMLGTFVLEPIGVESEVLWSMFDLFWELATPLEIALRIATAIAFLTWLHRASSNAHVLGDPPPQHSPGAAVGYWFVPCANLWLPYQVVSEIDRASDPEGRGTPSGWTASWWAAWVGSNVLSRFARGLEAEPNVAVSLVVIVAHLAAAVLAIVVIEQISRNQVARANRADSRTLARVFA